VGEQELFTLGVAIAVVVIVGRVLATRLEVPEAVVFVVLGVLASLIPQVPNIDLSPDLVLVLFLPPLVYNAAFAIAPTDAVAATAVMARLGAPTRVVTILEGESLINDGVALTAFGLAVEAMGQSVHGRARAAAAGPGGPRRDRVRRGRRVRGRARP
jgi:CPA1 family monovalent cation:H+ antiporter